MNGNPFDPRDRKRRFENPDFTRRILDSTSGSACGRAEDLLGARWDGEIAPMDVELLTAHLEHCVACRQLDVVLDRLQPVMPGMAEREPGPDFTAAVMARTSRRPVRTEVQLGWIERTAFRVHGGLMKLWNRPRFALEAAWTVATVASLILWSPLAPENAGDKTTDVVKAGGNVVPELVQQANRLVKAAPAVGELIFDPVAAKMDTFWQETSADVLKIIDRFRDDEPTDDSAPADTQDSDSSK